MIQIRRTDADNKDFQDIVALLDADLAFRDGEDHTFYDQYNKITNIKYALLAYDSNIAVGCGAIKEFDGNTMEVKRMFVIPEYRGKGIAGQILSSLELWAKELSFKKCVLETGKKQPKALALYKKHGYREIPNYGQYTGIENSVCFEKVLF